MFIRAARAEEAPALARIAWAAKAFWGYPPAQMEAWRTALSPSANSVSACPTFVAEQNGAPVGFYQLHPAPASVELKHLWICPRQWGQGLGRALLAHAMHHLVGLGKDSLHIDADPHAEGFYRRCGTQKLGDTSAPLAPSLKLRNLTQAGQSCEHPT